MGAVAQSPARGEHNCRRKMKMLVLTLILAVGWAAPLPPQSFGDFFRAAMPKIEIISEPSEDQEYQDPDATFDNYDIPSFPGFGAGFGSMPKVHVQIFKTSNENKFPSFGNNFPFGESFPFRQGFPFGSNTPFGDNIPEFDYDSLPFNIPHSSFGTKNEDSADEDIDPTSCGLFCSLLKTAVKTLFTIPKDIGDMVTELHNRKNDIDEEDGYDISNSTYTEKVLPDGTVVKVNKTVIADTDDDGNSFFFHSSILHNIDLSDEGKDGEIPTETPVDADKNEDVLMDETTTKVLNKEDEGIKEGTTEKEETTSEKSMEVEFGKVTEFYDPSENEIEETIDLRTADVRDLFE